MTKIEPRRPDSGVLPLVHTGPQLITLQRSGLPSGASWYIAFLSEGVAHFVSLTLWIGFGCVQVCSAGGIRVGS